MKRAVVLGLAAIGIVGAGVAAWAFWSRGRPDPQVAKVQELQAKLFTPPPAGQKLQPQDIEERRQAFGQLREEFEKLTPEQRQEMMKTPPPFAQRFQKDIEEYFALPAEKRREFLDRQIDQMEARRKEMQQMFAAGGFGRPGGGGSGQGNARPGGGGAGSGGQPRFDPQRGSEMRKRMLDMTTPEQRAQFSEFARAMSDRRKERGMPPIGGGGFF
ncbi:MAG: hypothetical protein HYX69_23400 [Planctomycetia bacterium]|nr:hypothetical protein [Planctomycetia bacterium]